MLQGPEKQSIIARNIYIYIYLLSTPTTSHYVEGAGRRDVTHTVTLSNTLVWIKKKSQDDQPIAQQQQMNLNVGGLF